VADTLEKFIKEIAAYEAAPHIGAKYWETRNIDLTEVAKRIRRDIKDDVRAGILPNAKYSVRISRGGRGYQLITVKTPGPKTNRPDPVSIGLRLQYLVKQYNYDASHGMYDWSCKRFFGDVEVGKRSWCA